MFDINNLDQWDEALKRLDTASPRLLQDLYREVMEDRQSRRTDSARKEQRAA